MFASRLAGLFAGLRQMPVTVLHVGGTRDQGEGKTPPMTPVERGRQKRRGRPKAAASAIKTKTRQKKGSSPAPEIEVIDRRPQTLRPRTRSPSEAAKGHDLMFVGLEPTAGAKGGFDDHISKIAKEFAGALAIATARGLHESEPLKTPLNILVPINGSEVSRRGAEVALALAKAAKAPMTALSVAAAGTDSTRQKLGHTRREDAEILKEISTLAKLYSVSIETAARSTISAEDAILRQARRGKHNLIVIGVSRRPGAKLSFGPIAQAILESSDRSILFVVKLRRRGAAAQGSTPLAHFSRFGRAAELVVARKSLRRQPAGIGAAARPIRQFLQRQDETSGRRRRATSAHLRP